MSGKLVYVLISPLVSGLILNNMLQSELKGKVPTADISKVTSSAFSISSLDLSDQQREVVIHAYMEGLHYVFISYVPLLGLCFFTGLFSRDNGLEGFEATPKKSTASEEDAHKVGLSALRWMRLTGSRVHSAR